MPIHQRRRFILAAAACGTLSACESWFWRAPEKGPLAAFIPLDTLPDADRLATLRGLERIESDLRIPVTLQQSAGVIGLEAALRNLAASDSTMMMVYGDEAAAVIGKIAADFPKQRFSAIQTEISDPQIASYSVAHEQSAWLAGTLAGLLSTKKIVGHVGDTRSPAALQERAAFYEGLRTSAAQAKFLSSFVAPDQLGRAATKQIAAGAEIIFHTLDDDTRLATISRERRLPLIGRGKDWLAETSGVYVAAAVADPGIAAFQAGQDLYDSLWKGGIQRRLGVENPRAVRLVMAEKIPAAIQQRVELFQRELKAGGYKIAMQYDLPDFKI
ncbi:MAG TPA: BMP family ABC transporter substrate-binding protein [Burkholderiales bacterium]|jgi:basic membrane protein A and related proteins|nr:BMP family ABC transporter substrate-binding protein [Burkholderiales bacterium]